MPTHISLSLNTDSSSDAAKVAAEVEKLQAIRKKLSDAQLLLEAEDRLMINRESFETVMKRKFIYGPAFSIYGGVAGLYDYGPPGCAIKANFLQRWRRHFIDTENMLEIDTTCLTPDIVLRCVIFFSTSIFSLSLRSSSLIFESRF